MVNLCLWGFDKNLVYILRTHLLHFSTLGRRSSFRPHSRVTTGLSSGKGRSRSTRRLQETGEVDTGRHLSLQSKIRASSGTLTVHRIPLHTSQLRVKVTLEIVFLFSFL